uniref:Glucose-methanol-choline oxidoreductase N-terminal domain-containing protein n=1 Tax=Timema cristinae TaxID=61476 RepID=A0A7R9GZH4_TIMCR|nr:unnamed protein product [Timema cristinae]
MHIGGGGEEGGTARCTELLFVVWMCLITGRTNDQATAAWSCKGMSSQCIKQRSRSNFGPEQSSFMRHVKEELDRCWGLVDPLWSIQHLALPDMEEVDFIVVGGGSGGSVVASRLSEVAHWQVALLEAGGPEPTENQVPAMYLNHHGPSNINWDFKLDPQTSACLGYKGGCCHWPRGKAMGGTSVLHGMMYMRGHPWDYDRWMTLGVNGWTFKDVLPYFIKSEDNRQIGTVAEPQYHGTGGYLTVQRFPDKPPLIDAILAGARELGCDTNVDLNGKRQLGFSVTQATVRNGARLSLAKAFIHPVLGRKNLRISLHSMTSWLQIQKSRDISPALPDLSVKQWVWNRIKLTLVTKVIVDPLTRRALGVQYRRRGETFTRTLIARKEVILCAGAIQSPQLLLLSGIGPASELLRVDRLKALLKLFYCVLNCFRIEVDAAVVMAGGGGSGGLSQARPIREGSCHSNRCTLPDFLTVTEYACIVITRQLLLCGNYALQPTHHANSRDVATMLPSLPTTQTLAMWQLCSLAYPPIQLPLCGNYAPQPTQNANSRDVATMLPSLPATRILDQFKSHYRNLGVPVVHNLPRVGKNLVNHVSFTLNCWVSGETAYQRLNKKTLNQFLHTRSGPMASTGLSQLTGFVRLNLTDVSTPQSLPDIQVFFAGYMANDSSTGCLDEMACNGARYINIVPTLLRPRSKGELTLRSSDAMEPPSIKANYLQHQEDVDYLIEAIRFCERLIQTEPMRRKGVKLDTVPVAGCQHLPHGSRNYWECALRHLTNPENHQAGTCAMGRSEMDSVLDSRLRVHGLKGLRVIDASAIPMVPSYVRFGDYVPVTLSLGCVRFGWCHVSRHPQSGAPGFRLVRPPL